MQEIDTTRERTPTDPEYPNAGLRPSLGLFHWRYLVVYLVLIGLVLLAVLPPLLNVSRFKRRIVTSISTSIGRPVHLDNVSLVLLPFPGFKLENFVVEEAPAFGAEPIIHASNVVATLRVSTLWRRKVEFSKISLQEPSINLVHLPDGRWNVESILLQAAKIPAAPTAQPKAGPDPRFPYIEATGARVNLKYGDEKLPLSLTEADFSLWLPRPQQWRLRMEGKPTRTDTSASDTGTVSLEGTLARAERFELIPFEAAGEWRNVPLGEASRVVLGHDAGLRGEMRLNFSAHGTIGESFVKTSLQLRGARRADFVPPQSLNLRVECQATAAETFHAFHQVRCSWPPPATSLLALTTEIASIHNAGAAPFELGTPGLPAATLLEWLRVASPRVSPDVVASGILTGSLTRELQGGVYSGHLALSGVALKGGAIGDSPITLGNAILASAPTLLAPDRPSRRNRTQASSAFYPVAGEFVMPPATLDLGGKEPALLEGHFDPHGYSLHLYGTLLPSRLLALAGAIPQFGDGLSALVPPASLSTAKEAPVHVDMVSNRMWGEGQTWAKTAPKTTHSASDKRH